MQHTGIHGVGDKKPSHHNVMAPAVWPFRTDAHIRCRRLDDRHTGGGWWRYLWSDEVYWDQVLTERNDRMAVLQFPFVPGFFVAEFEEEDDQVCSYVLAGPFRHLYIAKTALLMMRKL